MSNFYINGTGTEEYFRIRELAYKLRYCLESRVKIDGLFYNKENFKDILDNLKNIPKWDEAQVVILNEIYSFCNLNWSHEWTCEWYNGLRKNFKAYCDLGYCVLPTIP